jgi:hypothetical protein
MTPSFRSPHYILCFHALNFCIKMGLKETDFEDVDGVHIATSANTMADQKA